MYLVWAYLGYVFVQVDYQANPSNGIIYGILVPCLSGVVTIGVILYSVWLFSSDRKAGG